MGSAYPCRILVANGRGSVLASGDLFAVGLAICVTVIFPLAIEHKRAIISLL